MAAVQEGSDSEDSNSQNTTFYHGYGNDSFKIYYNNVQSLRLHLEDLYHESSEVQLIAATETWLGPTVEDNVVRINGFQSIIRKDRPGDAHGGVALYIRNGIVSKRREDLETLDLEFMWNEVVLPFGKSLNLFARGMSETPECECGALFETTSHYFMSCPMYNDLRQQMKDELPPDCWTVETLLNGDSTLSRINVLIQEQAQKYIINRERFKR